MLTEPAHMAFAERSKFPRRFGPYVIVNFLGEGGMGSVYLALMGHKGSERFCVIKQMGSAWSDIATENLPGIEERFSREAEITRALLHPSIAKTFAVGDEQGAYFVQEFIDGIDLRHLVPRVQSAGESISVALASFVVLQVAGALSYLHDFESRGLVHRDVTPDNIMLAANGDVKLIDFGVAKATAHDDGLTQRGVIGKAQWLAPEIFHGAKLDRRADIYSLGLVYWYLLTRREPDSEPSTRTPSNDRFVPPSTFNSEVSPELDSVVARAVDPDPNLRFQTASELLQAVARHVPEGFDGKAEVANVIFRNTSQLAGRFFSMMLEKGRPLLDDAPVAAPPTREMAVGNTVAEPVIPLTSEAIVPIPSGKRRQFVLVSFGAAIVLGGVLFVILRDGRAVQSPLVTLPQPIPTLAAPASSQPAVVQPTHPPSPPLPAPIIVPRQAASSQPPPIHKTPPMRQETVPEKPAPQPSAQDLFVSAQDSFDRSEISEALNFAKRAAHGGAGAPAYVLLGRILAIRHDLNGAEAAYEEALRLAPDNGEAKRRLERLRRKTPDDTP